MARFFGGNSMGTTDSKHWIKQLGSKSPAVLLFLLLLVLSTLNGTHAYSLKSQLRNKKNVALFAEKNSILRKKDIELTTSAGHSTTTKKKKHVHEKRVSKLSAFIHHDDAIIGLDNMPNADDNAFNSKGISIRDATDESSGSLNPATVFEPFDKKQQQQFEFDHEILARNEFANKGKDSTTLDNGASIVHTKYIVDSADNLIHLHLDDKIEALSCGEDHVLTNTTGCIHDFDAVWQNGSIL